MIKQLVENAEKQHRALKLRIYPTEQQEILINKTFGCCRQIYNNRLFEKNQFYAPLPWICKNPSYDPLYDKIQRLLNKKIGGDYGVLRRKNCNIF